MHPTLKKIVELDTVQRDEIDRLRAVNAQLLEALQKIADADHPFCLAPQDLQDIAKQAIANADDIPATPEQLAAEIAMDPLAYLGTTSHNGSEALQPQSRPPTGN